MATFLVVNNNPDFEIPDGSGFWYRVNNDGGIDLNTDDDGTDDVVIAPAGASNNGLPGIFIWINQSFEVDDADATILENSLDDESFYWLPKNPDYDNIAPLLKDGSTVNTAFDNSGNPLLSVANDRTYTGAADYTATLAVFPGEICKHFTVTVS